MNGFAALAVKEAAAASGHGASLLPAIAPSALDGFAVGALVSALCVLLVMVTRRISRRSRLSARNGASQNRQDAPGTSHLSAALSAAPVLSAAPIYSGAPAAASPFADESAEMVMARAIREDTAQLPELSELAALPELDEYSFESAADSFQPPEVKSAAGHRRDRSERRDRLDRVPESRRGAGRHAAPSIGATGRMASRRALLPMAARD